MSILPRKLTFQLTPLLDLLLIVIFAQYLDVQETAQQHQAEIQQQADAEATALRVERERDAAQLSAAESRLEELQVDSAKLQQLLQKRELELSREIHLALQREEQVGNLVAELFQVPQELVKQALKPRNPTNPIRSQQEIEKLQQAFRKLSRKRGREVIKHLLTFEELRKRCDIWELYVAENGLILFSSDKHTHEFRAESAQDFATRIFERYKSLPQPKSLVIILLSWGDAKAAPRQAAIDGLPLAIDRMRADSSGRARFEYAVLGFNPRPSSRSLP